MVQVVEYSLQTPETRRSNPVIGELIFNQLYLKNLSWKDENKAKSHPTNTNKNKSTNANLWFFGHSEYSMAEKSVVENSQIEAGNLKNFLFENGFAVRYIGRENLEMDFKILPELETDTF